MAATVASLSPILPGNRASKHTRTGSSSAVPAMLTDVSGKKNKSFPVNPTLVLELDEATRLRLWEEAGVSLFLVTSQICQTTFLAANPCAGLELAEYVALDTEDTLANLTTENGETPLYLVVLNNAPLAALRWLLSLDGAAWQLDSPAIDGNTPLSLAVRRCCEAPTQQLARDYFLHAQTLLQAGASPNFVDGEGYSPLHRLCKTVASHSAAGRACAGNRTIWLRLAHQLLKAGADLNARARTYDGSAVTPLFAALPDIELVTMLLNTGADATVKDNYGRGLLSVLADSGALFDNTPQMLALVEAAAKAGADTNGITTIGPTKLSLLSAALESGNTELVAVLRKYGAKLDIAGVDSLKNAIVSARASTAKCLLEYPSILVDSEPMFSLGVTPLMCCVDALADSPAAHAEAAQRVAANGRLTFAEKRQYYNQCFRPRTEKTANDLAFEEHVKLRLADEAALAAYEIAEALIEAGASPVCHLHGAGTPGPLEGAIIKEHAELARKMMASLAKKDGCTNLTRRTPIIHCLCMWIVRNNLPAEKLERVIALAVEIGVDINAKDSEEHTALYYYQGHTGPAEVLARCLRAHGATP